MPDVDVDKEVDRGQLGQRAKEVDRGFGGGPAVSASIATDLFHRVSQLGGLLVVAVVAPIGPSPGSTAGHSSTQRALLGIGETSSEQPPKDRVANEQDQKARGLLEKRAMISGGD